MNIDIISAFSKNQIKIYFIFINNAPLRSYITEQEAEEAAFNMIGSPFADWAVSFISGEKANRIKVFNACYSDSRVERNIYNENFKEWLAKQWEGNINKIGVKTMRDIYDAMDAEDNCKHL